MVASCWQSHLAFLEFRQQGNITLAELSVVIGKPIAELSAAAQLIMVFGAEQLPVAAAIAAARPEECIVYEQYGLRKSTVQSLDEAALWDTYLSWVQATLLHVIDEVLNQQQLWTAEPAH
jgi:hypothetical protein